MLLVVDRLVALLVGEHPDLIEMRGLGIRGVEFAVGHAGARAHVLDVAGLNHRAVAHAVLVSERAFKHVSDDFHVAMRMRGETAAAGNAIVVHDPQGTELYVLRVVVSGERKSETAVEPAVIGVAAVLALTDVNHDGLLGNARGIIYVITIIVNRYIVGRGVAVGRADGRWLGGASRGDQ